MAARTLSIPARNVASIDRRGWISAMVLRLNAAFQQNTRYRSRQPRLRRRRRRVVGALIAVQSRGQKCAMQQGKMYYVEVTLVFWYTLMKA
jgi:hypothetical protein